MRRPAFSVVTGAVATLVALGYASRFLLPYIPKPIENSFANEPSEFLSRASVQRIDWKKPTPEAFAEARRKDKPIFLFIGTSYNPFAREFDEGALMSAQVQAYLARNFLCIRADALSYPEFRGAFLPVSRALASLLPGFQVWILDPSGKLIDLIPRNVALYGTDESGFLDALVQARHRFEDPKSGLTKLDFNEFEQKDLKALRELGPATPPPFDDYANHLLEVADTTYGGFKTPGIKIVVPEAWRFLLLSGRIDDFHSTFDPALKTPAVDLLDGGFFHIAHSDDWSAIEFEKATTSNAAMLRLLAQASGTLKSPLYRWLALRTFDCLSHELTREGVVYACRLSDAGVDGRSARSSFGVRKLRDTFSTDTDHAWAQLKLGLSVETNPRMVPRLADPRIIQTQPDKLDKILRLLRSNTGPRPERAGGGYLDVTAYTVARLTEAARIMGDRARLDVALDMFDDLEAFRTGDDVIHTEQAGLRTGYLGDYLAYADAALQSYLACGRQQCLQQGKRVLRRAIFLFGVGQSGVLNLVSPKPKPMPDVLVAPELADPSCESTTAQAIRLCQDYARILSGSDPESEALFRKIANGATGGYGVPAELLGQFGAGFFCASASVFDDAFVVTTGPQAQALADKIASRLPTRLAVPAFADVRADVQARGPGAYIVRGVQIEGPMPADQVVLKLSPYFALASGF